MSKLMVHQSLKKSAWILIPLVFLVIAILFIPFRYSFELNYDEGVNLIKALLINQGYRLYTDIWSDQPPLLTLILTWVFSIFGFKVVIGRLIILLFSTLLLFTSALYLSEFWGLMHAIAGGVLIILLPYYLDLSVAVMIGLPAIALAVVSFYFLSKWHKNQQWRWLLASSLFLALSVLVKLYTGLLAPVFTLGLLFSALVNPQHKRRINSYFPAIIWSVVFLIVVFLLSLLLIGPESYPQIITSHLEAITESEFILRANELNIESYLFQSLPLIVASVFSIFISLHKRSWTSMYLIGWAVVAYLVLRGHRPIWFHHQHLILIPVAILAGISLGEALKVLKNMAGCRPISNEFRAYIGIITLSIIFLLFSMVPSANSQLDYNLPNLRAPREMSEEFLVLAELNARKGAARTIVTDRPMFAFRANLYIPPELGAFSNKRYLTGEITQNDVIDIIDSYKPEQILIARYVLEDVRSHIADDYASIIWFDTIKLYIRKGR